MPTPKDIETFCPSGPAEWRKWLKKNHVAKSSIWLVYYRKGSGKPSLSWSEAVDEAICFGWIDSTRKTIDAESFMQLFSKRKPRSTWSKINKEKVQRLTEQGLIAQAGLDSIDAAKKNGSWAALDEVETLAIPKDLEKAFKTKPGSKEYFTSLSKSARKMILHWLASAKRAETREKRIAEVVERAGQGLKPKHVL